RRLPVADRRSGGEGDEVARAVVGPQGDDGRGRLLADALAVRRRLVGWQQGQLGGEQRVEGRLLGGVEGNQHVVGGRVHGGIDGGAGGGGDLDVVGGRALHGVDGVEDGRLHHGQAARGEQRVAAVGLDGVEGGLVPHDDGVGPAAGRQLGHDQRRGGA